MNIREATEKDIKAIWGIFKIVVQSGDTFAFAPDTNFAEMQKIWFAPGMNTFVAEENGKITGSYFIKPNQPGLGSHIANCGYIVDPVERGKGIASQMCAHSMEIAKMLGYKGMQYNLVVSTNVKAVKLWEKCGFKIIGTIPGGFNHHEFGYVDAFIMFHPIN
ncbi:GNAT family N-acetyltransferase [uncultured Mucilaginibacter sp.]|uniref:GNAT family N-acetyltransferase n=1 Tax=uncultured Mucilaginibacter sp. TaxID=797541 RepID=UPI0025FA8FA0|nr:GNAT family N-acetyltransferase [uncultured Mucilaginibacter sp.]